MGTKIFVLGAWCYLLLQGLWLNDLRKEATDLKRDRAALWHRVDALSTDCVGKPLHESKHFRKKGIGAKR